MSTNKLKEIIKNSNNITFLGGAGVSTASGIPDFRSTTGIFNEKLNNTFKPEDIVSKSFFKKHPEEFFEFYKSKMIYKEARPNKAHIALARLECMNKLRGIVTQNIDGLHQMAGSKKVYEIHGSIHRNYCTRCNAFYNLDFLINSEGVPMCERCGYIIKPDIVLYEEELNRELYNEAANAIGEADTLIVGGTSFSAYPAADMIRFFRGSKIVVINKSEIAIDSNVDLVFNDPIDEVLFNAVEYNS